MCIHNIPPRQPLLSAVLYEIASPGIESADSRRFYNPPLAYSPSTTRGFYPQRLHTNPYLGTCTESSPHPAELRLPRTAAIFPPRRVQPKRTKHIAKHQEYKTELLRVAGEQGQQLTRTNATLPSDAHTYAHTNMPCRSVSLRIHCTTAVHTWLRAFKNWTKLLNTTALICIQ